MGRKLSISSSFAPTYRPSLYYALLAFVIADLLFVSFFHPQPSSPFFVHQDHDGLGSIQGRCRKDHTSAFFTDSSQESSGRGYQPRRRRQKGLRRQRSCRSFILSHLVGFKIPTHTFLHEPLCVYELWLHD